MLEIFPLKYKLWIKNKLYFPKGYLEYKKHKVFLNPADMDFKQVIDIVKEDKLLKATREFCERNKENMFIDIGCNYGLFSLKNYNVSKNTYAFEVNSNISRYFRKTIIKNSLPINLENKGLYSKEGSMELNIRGQSGSGFLEKGGCKKNDQREITTLDDYFRSKKIDEHLVIKIDVEGCEPLVFEGGADFLNRFKTIYGITEFNNSYISSRFDINPQKFFRMLQEKFNIFASFPHSEYLYDINDKDYTDLLHSYFIYRPGGPNLHLNIMFSTENDIPEILKGVFKFSKLPMKNEDLSEKRLGA